MSDMAKKARAAMKERAQRRAEPAKGDIDASGWREPLMETTKKTGARQISKRAFKRGGKVNLKAEGAEGMKHAGKKPRGKHDDAAMDKKLIKTMVSKKALKKADGGQTVNRAGKGDYAGSYPADLSNEELAKIRAGEAERAKKEQQWQNTTAVGKKRGGKVHDGCACKACGGRMGRASGGDVDDTPPDAMAGRYNEDAVNKSIASSNRSGKKIGKKESALIHSLLKGRAESKGGGNADPDDQFKHPYFGDVRQYEGKKWDEEKEKWVDKKGRTERKAGGRTKKGGGGGFGMDSPFKGKGGNMLDMGAQFLSPAYSIARGKLPGMLGMLTGALGKKSGGATKGNYEGGTRPTGGRIARKDGGKVKGKGKTNIHININTAPKPDAMGMPMPLPPMPLKPPPGLPPAAAMGAPGMMPPAGGPPMPPAGGVPMGLPPGAPPMMGRKAGGRVHRSYKDMDAGAGGGLGRLEKTEIQKSKR